MSDDQVFVNFSMNCLPARRDDGYASPPSWDAARGAVEGFCQLVADAGMGATLFVASDVCKRQREALRGLDNAGVEMGLLSDPRLEGFRGYLTSYKIDQQKEVISMGCSRFGDAFGREPETFRPAEFSANTDTFIAVCELGFHQGSFSLPERHVTACGSNWRGAYPFAHHVDPLDVLQPGTLELYDVPVTSDLDKTTLNGQEEFTPLFLGTEQADIETHAAFLVAQHLARMKRDDVHVKTISCLSTNCGDYAGADGRGAKMLALVIDTIRREADKHGMVIVPATFEQIHSEADRMYEAGKQT